MKSLLSALLIFGLAFSIFATDAKKLPLPIISPEADSATWKEFLRLGGGYYPIPEDLKGLIKATMVYAKFEPENWHKRPGYSNDENQQIEIQMLKKRKWQQDFPAPTSFLAEEMNAIAIAILKHSLAILDVDEELWGDATKGLTDDNGSSSFKIARYNPERRAVGIDWHKDVRWMTVLYAPQEGLLAKINGQQVKLPPKAGYFLVNVGVFFEAFINNSDLVNGLEHKVSEVKEWRHVCGVFVRGRSQNKSFAEFNNGDLIWKPGAEINSRCIAYPPGHFVSPAHLIGVTPES
jgi:hypothetical protein